MSDLAIIVLAFFGFCAAIFLVPLILWYLADRNSEPISCDDEPKQPSKYELHRRFMELQRRMKRAKTIAK